MTDLLFPVQPSRAECDTQKCGRTYIYFILQIDTEIIVTEVFALLIIKRKMLVITMLAFHSLKHLLSAWNENTARSTKWFDLY